MQESIKLKMLEAQKRIVQNGSCDDQFGNEKRIDVKNDQRFVEPANPKDNPGKLIFQRYLGHKKELPGSA